MKISREYIHICRYQNVPSVTIVKVVELIAMLSSILFFASLLANLTITLPAFASHFVYCHPSADGVSTCSGWKGNKTLNCVSSIGNVASCSTQAGEKVTCTQDRNQIAYCVGIIQATSKKARQDIEECTFIGGGSYSCQNKKNGSDELLPLNSIKIDNSIE